MKSMHIFETLNDFAVGLLTASVDSNLGRLTCHHCRDEADARRVLRSAILTRTLPGESAGSRWGILRIFMRNLVNRAQAPMPPEKMLALLDEVTHGHDAEAARVSALAEAIRGNERLHLSLQALLDPDRAPVAGGDYLDWIAGRLARYATMSVASIDPEAVMDDVRHLADDPRTRIPHMRTALAANFLADLGVRALGKPDLHVLPTMRGVLGHAGLSAQDCIRELIRAGQREASAIRDNARFHWLDGGLYPRDVDRVIYLIGSDNFRLDGRKMRQAAPRRRQLMLETLGISPE
jgi:hypothetical protein